MPSHKFEVVFNQEQIQKRVQELGEQISKDYRDRTLHIFGVLENCFLFMADLVRYIDLPQVCHFIKAEVHDISQAGHPLREIIYTSKINATGKDVILVDGILQSGVTLDYLFRYILGQNPRSVRTALMIEKVDERKVDVPTDYVGFKVESKFLVGYGLGHQEMYRNLPYLATLS